MNNGLEGAIKISEWTFTDIVAHVRWHIGDKLRDESKIPIEILRSKSRRLVLRKLFRSIGLLLCRAV